jgi:PAS domain S-box-containing protein
VSRLRHNVGWILVTVATLLMLGRRIVSLYAVATGTRLADPAAECIALVISVFMVVGMTLLLRWYRQETSQDSTTVDIAKGPLDRIKHQAILLGILSVLGASGLTYFAYEHTRDAITERLSAGSLDLAHMLETAATISGGDRPSALRELDRLWRRAHSQYPQNYLCVIGTNGHLLLNTRRPDRVGFDVGNTVIPGGLNGPRTVRELARSGRDWTGRNLNAEGHEQIAAYAYSTNLSALVAIHLPTAGVDGQIRAAALPWALGFAATLVVILPFSLALLYRVASSSQRSTLAALHQQHAADERFRRIVETGREGIWMIDAENRTTFANQRMADLLGCSVQEMADRSMLDFMDDDGRALAATSGERLRPGVPEQHEFKFQRKDGVPLWTLVSTNPLKDAQGRYSGALAMVSDITPRKELEMQLTETSKRLRAIIETEPECVKIVGPKGDLIEMNPAGLAMIEADSLSDAQRRPLMEFISPEYREEFKRLHRSVFGGEAGMLVFEVVGLKGTRRWLETHAAPLRDSNGAVTALLGVTRDITARRTAEEEIRQLNAGLEKRVRQRTAQLEAANLELEAFSYSVSHDLRAPLRHISGFSGLLQTECGTRLSGPAQQHLKNISDAAVRMSGLTDALLELSKISRAGLQHEPVNLSALARDVLAEVRQADPDRRIEVEIASDLEARGDRRLLRILLSNLFSNAWKYTRRQPVPRIEFRRLDGNHEAVYQVRDNGAGFDMAFAGKLFGAFQRLHTQEEFEGVGVGLATVQRIVHRHGGRVWAEAEVGKGATFYFTVPDDAPIEETNGGATARLAP